LPGRRVGNTGKMNQITYIACGGSALSVFRKSDVSTSLSTEQGGKSWTRKPHKQNSPASASHRTPNTAQTRASMEQRKTFLPEQKRIGNLFPVPQRIAEINKTLSNNFQSYGDTFFNACVKLTAIKKALQFINTSVGHFKFPLVGLHSPTIAGPLSLVESPATIPGAINAGSVAPHMAGAAPNDQP
jgi:hypothetical protein